jgi:hypothetical protein
MDGLRRSGVGREAVADDVDGFVFGDLEEAGGLARGGAVHIEDVEGSGLSLRGEFGGVVGEVAQIVHLLVREEKIGVGPALDSLRGADLDETAAEFDDVEFIAMLDGGDGGGFRGEVFAEIEGDGSYVGDAGRWLLGRAGGTGGENEEEKGG